MRERRRYNKVVRFCSRNGCISYIVAGLGFLRKRGRGSTPFLLLCMFLRLAELGQSLIKVETLRINRGEIRMQIRLTALRDSAATRIPSSADSDRSAT